MIFLFVVVASNHSFYIQMPEEKEQESEADPSLPQPNDAIKKRHDPYVALRLRNFQLYLAGGFISLLGRQMLLIAVIWQIYEITHSATALGLLGLLHAVPLIVLAIPAGQVADRFNRKGIFLVSLFFTAVLSACMAVLTIKAEAVPNLPILQRLNGIIRKVAYLFEKHGDTSDLDFDSPILPLLYLLIFLMAVMRVFSNPARVALLTQLIPVKAFPNAVTWRTSSSQISKMAGPALGGLCVGYLSLEVVYFTAAACALFMFVMLLLVKPRPVELDKKKITPSSAMAGVKFIWSTKVILAALTLDLFAVLLGGVDALLPIYADQILGVGAVGMGWLRAAPSVGAFCMAIYIAYSPPMRRPGVILLWSTALYGIAIMLFGVSSWFWLSFFVLFLTGLFDNVSVIVRQTVVLLMTPDRLRGRVSAVNQVFVGSSNELGSLRAGIMAALLGPVAAVVIGGVGTLAIVGLVSRIFPELKGIKSLHKLRPKHDENRVKTA